ncbi:isoprenoid synthase domain-containing protein [Apiospora arundinis]|uniref:(2E,6E)-farnesyl diphosphate synthase n=1 Tax=Apiospora arundinis TaxID=335852 RepID=A0ABR2JHB6_9PEZI
MTNNNNTLPPAQLHHLPASGIKSGAVNGAAADPVGTNEKILRAPIDYLLTIPGKDVRGKMMNAFNQWLQIPEEKLDIIKEVIKLLHTASLLIDDIQDNSRLRRGLPVAHSIFGVAQTINTANYAYFLAQQELNKLECAAAYEVFTEELLRLHQGQGMDIYWRDSSLCPTEEEYFEMVGNKTGGLFRLAVRLMQLASNKDCDFVPFVNVLGILFQIRDDYLNLQSDLYTKNKGFGEDLTEGKFSFPIIHSIRADPASITLTSILKQRTEDEDVKRYAISYIESTGSFEHCRRKIDELVGEARMCVKDMSPEDAKVADGIMAMVGLGAGGLSI